MGEITISELLIYALTCIAITALCCCAVYVFYSSYITFWMGSVLFLSNGRGYGILLPGSSGAVIKGRNASPVFAKVRVDQPAQGYDCL